jgi:hypothetical protein
VPAVTDREIQVPAVTDREIQVPAVTDRDRYSVSPVTDREIQVPAVTDRDTGFQQSQIERYRCQQSQIEIQGSSSHR